MLKLHVNDKGIQVYIYSYSTVDSRILALIFLNDLWRLLYLDSQTKTSLSSNPCKYKYSKHRTRFVIQQFTIWRIEPLIHPKSWNKEQQILLTLNENFKTDIIKTEKKLPIYMSHIRLLKISMHYSSCSFSFLNFLC